MLNIYRYDWLEKAEAFEVFKRFYLFKKIGIIFTNFFFMRKRKRRDIYVQYANVYVCACNIYYLLLCFVKYLSLDIYKTKC